MKKLLFVFAIAAFASCNNATEEATKAADSVVTEAAKTVDSAAAATVDSAAAAAH